MKIYFVIPDIYLSSSFCLGGAFPGVMDCADCQDNFEKFWCAVNTPPCGTIDKVLDEILVCFLFFTINVV